MSISKIWMQSMNMRDPCTCVSYCSHYQMTNSMIHSKNERKNLLPKSRRALAHILVLELLSWILIFVVFDFKYSTWWDTLMSSLLFLYLHLSLMWYLRWLRECVYHHQCSIQPPLDMAMWLISSILLFKSPWPETLKNKSSTLIAC